MIVFSILTPLENVMKSILDFFHVNVGLPWAWSIVALTILVRIVLVPLTVRQIHSMQSLQAHGPEMKQIQQKYKGDKQRLNEELMKFYKENEINPAASCLPMLVQLPVFFALYFVLRNFAKHVEAPVHELGWLIVPNITAKITAHWSGYVLLVVYVASQVGYAFFGLPPATPKAQRYMFMVLPVLFVPVITRFPVGLLMYWMTTNLWTIGQGIVTRRLTPQPQAPPKRSSRTPAKEDAGGNGSAPAAAPPSAPSTPPAAPRRVKRKRKGGR